MCVCGCVCDCVCDCDCVRACVCVCVCVCVYTAMHVHETGQGWRRTSCACCSRTANASRSAATTCTLAVCVSAAVLYVSACDSARTREACSFLICCVNACICALYALYDCRTPRVAGPLPASACACVRVRVGHVGRHAQTRVPVATARHSSSASVKPLCPNSWGPFQRAKRAKSWRVRALENPNRPTAQRGSWRAGSARGPSTEARAPVNHLLLLITETFKMKFEFFKNRSLIAL